MDDVFGEIKRESFRLNELCDKMAYSIEQTERKLWSAHCGITASVNRGDVVLSYVHGKICVQTKTRTTTQWIECTRFEKMESFPLLPALLQEIRDQLQKLNESYKDKL